MSEAQVIFSSGWLRDKLAYQQHLDDFQFAMVEKLQEKDATTFVVTTTRDMDTGIRNHWFVETEYEDSTLFYQHLMNDAPGALDVYEDVDGVVYARYQDGNRSSIWKFHFLDDIEFVIDNTLTKLGSIFFEDFRDTVEAVLQDHNFLSYTEEVSVDFIDEGNQEGQFFLSLPYMQDPIVHGILYYDQSVACWMLEEGTVSYDDAFDTYIDECLY